MAEGPAHLGKIGLGLSLAPWVTLPLVILVPQFRAISFCFYCFSPIALLASLAGLNAGAEKKYAVAGVVFSALFYAGLIVLYALGNALPDSLRDMRP